jgi:hypothetical protein
MSGFLHTHPLGEPHESRSTAVFRIKDILAHETGDQKIYRLAENMMSTPEQFQKNLELLEALNRGLLETLPAQ